MPITAIEFREKFDFTSQDFSNPIEWTDGVGFSILKDYGDGHVSLYKIGISNKELNKNEPLKKLWISVNYGEKLEGGVTLEPRKHSVWDPINLDFKDEYYYNIDNHKFYRNDLEIDAQQILANVKNAHELPTKMMPGLILRLRLWCWREALPNLVIFADKRIIDLLWLISGEKIEPNIYDRLFGRRHPEYSNKSINEKDIKFIEPKLMDFFGYKAKRWSVVFYCIINLIIYAIYFFSPLRYQFLSKLIVNNFLALCYIVVSFAITEALVPRFLMYIIMDTMPKLLENLQFKIIKIK
ncbi:MAG TPA: hypothetical protein VMC41_03550 [Candidatus Nanoarchaeia archaeon]|nr:hypothetical protein [Candidatus Nanoarchaeia archaeon]